MKNKKLTVSTKDKQPITTKPSAIKPLKREYTAVFVVAMVIAVVSLAGIVLYFDKQSTSPQAVALNNRDDIEQSLVSRGYETTVSNIETNAKNTDNPADAAKNYYEAAVLSFNQQKLDQAYSYAQQSIDTAPTAEAYALQAHIASIKEQYSQAANLYAKAAELSPEPQPGDYDPPKTQYMQLKMQMDAKTQ